MYVLAVAGGEEITDEVFDSAYAASVRGAAERAARRLNQRVAVRKDDGTTLFLIEPDGTRLPPGGQTVCTKAAGYCPCVPCRTERQAQNA